MRDNLHLRPGKYKQFKGGEYELLFTAWHSETLEPMMDATVICSG